MKNIFVTSALPYANGDLHLGHMLEFVQTDIWVRYNILIGNKCIFISGIDAHGTPIMLRANMNKVTPEHLINEYFLSHKKDLNSFNISYNNFYTTHSYENEILSRKFFKKLVEKGFVFIKEIHQLYDLEKNIFLPDRYVVGTCPKCYSVDQYGDVCEKCCYRYDAIDLIDPISVLSKAKPVRKNSKHYFFNLCKFASFLKSWCFGSLSQNQIVNKLSEWFDHGLKEWDISRDDPYFGFKVPCDYNKFFYVWMDAPIGYLSSFLNFSIRCDKHFYDFFLKTKSYDLYHFIGKDIMYFHALFWPAVLKGMGYHLPKDIFVHGFLTVNGKKMSKSAGTFITARQFSNEFNVEYFRFYIASKLTSSVVDIDLNFEDFVNKINSDLIGKFFNIFSRCTKIIIDNYDAMLSDKLIDSVLFYDYLNLFDKIILLYEERKYSDVIFYAMKYADRINLYIDREKPWRLLKHSETFGRAQEVCTMSINLFLILLFYLSPVMPDLSKQVERVLNIDLSKVLKLKKPVLNIKIASYSHFVRRINLDNFKFL